MTPQVPTVHDQIAQGLRDHPAKKGMNFNLLVTAMEIGGSIGLFHLARAMGASDVVAYLAGSIGPVAGGVTIWIRARKFSGASASIFAFTALSAVIAVFAGRQRPGSLGRTFERDTHRLARGGRCGSDMVL